MVSATGWTFTYIREELLWPDLIGLFAHWHTDPPLNEVVTALGAHFGLKKQEVGVTKNTQSLDDLGAIMGIQITRNKKPKQPTKPTPK